MLSFMVFLACAALIVQAAQQKPTQRRATACAEAAPVRPPAPDPDAEDAEAAIIATCDYAAALLRRAELAKTAATDARREADRLRAELGRAHSDARREHLSADLAAAEALHAKRDAEAMRLYAQAAGLNLRAGNIRRQAEKRAAKR